MQKIISSGLVSYERLPMLEIVFDRLVRIMSTIAAQLHLGQRRGRHRQHPVAALRRLSELDPAAGDAGRVQGRGVGQLRPDGGRFRDDLLDRGRAAGRPPRHRGDAHRGPALHHDRAHAGRAADPGRAGRSLRQLRSAVPGHLPLRAAGGEPALRHHQPAVECRRAGAAAHRHGGSRRPDGAAAALRHAGAGARTAAAAVHGREIRPRLRSGKPIWPRSCGTPRSSWTWCWTSRRCGCPT